jgi:hypothetical protein
MAEGEVALGKADIPVAEGEVALWPADIPIADEGPSLFLSSRQRTHFARGAGRRGMRWRPTTNRGASRVSSVRS